MRVLLTADTVGGVWDYACNLARSLDAEGHDVLLAVHGEVGDRQRRLPPGVEVTARPYRLEWMPESEADVVESSTWVAELAGLWEADIVHLNQFSPALASFEVPTVVVAHSDVLSWFSESLGAPAPDEWHAYAERVRKALLRATAVVTPTQYQSRLLQRHYGRAADRVIHNGVVPPEAPGENAEAMVVCAARAWDSAKGVGILDAAAGLLGTSAPPIHLFGDTSSPLGEHLHTRHLLLHGALGRDELDSWLERASVYAGPSLYEPFGLAPLEAALHGCALVLSDIGSFRELWDGCAEFFPPGDAARLAELLSSLIGDDARIARLARAGRRRALRRYTAENMSQAYMALYAELAPRRSRRAVARALQQPA